MVVFQYRGINDDAGKTATANYLLINENKMVSNKLLAKRDLNEFLKQNSIFLMILTTSNTSYQWEDNIYVVPITLLKD